MDGVDPKADLLRLLQADPAEQAAEAAAATPAGPRITIKGTRFDTWGKLNHCKAAATVEIDADSQHWLGMRYMEGRTTRQDQFEALRWLRWLRRAAGQGNYEAQCALGKWYSTRQVACGLQATTARDICGAAIARHRSK